jgi:hypothetical protein
MMRSFDGFLTSFEGFLTSFEGFLTSFEGFLTSFEEILTSFDENPSRIPSEKPLKILKPTRRTTTFPRQLPNAKKREKNRRNFLACKLTLKNKPFSCATQRVFRPGSHMFSKEFKLEVAGVES